MRSASGLMHVWRLPHFEPPSRRADRQQGASITPTAVRSTLPRSRRGDRMRRRSFIRLLGGAATWPLAARAQQQVPVIGVLHTASLEAFRSQLAAFHQGSKYAGYVAGQNVAIEYRWAEDRLDRL